MNKLLECWYESLQPLPGKEFYNHSLKTKSLCVNSIASILDQRIDPQQEEILSCIAFQVIEAEIGSLLFSLRRASYPVQDPFDSDKLYDLDQMIRVAEYFQVNFVLELLKEAKRIHTIKGT